MVFSPTRIALLLTFVIVAVLCGMVGGPANAVDVALIREGIAARAAGPFATDIGLVLNYVGGAPVTLLTALGGTVALWWGGKHRRAIAFATVLLGGRLLVEAIKLLVHRARPALDPHPVLTHSLSFPSAHAANSMIVFPAIALFFLPAFRRGGALFAAVSASLLIGASRVLLGVHWPSDVVAGWAVGAAWLNIAWAFAQRLAPDEAQHDVVGGHRPAFIQK